MGPKLFALLFAFCGRKMTSVAEEAVEQPEVREPRKKGKHKKDKRMLFDVLVRVGSLTEFSMGS